MSQICEIPFIELFDIYKETDNSTTPNLTEENIYKFSEEFFKNNSERIPVFSGATLNEGITGFVPNFTKKDFKDFEKGKKYTYNSINYYKNEDKGCITIIADGKAGVMFIRKYEDYPVFCMNISSMAIFNKDYKKIKEKYPNFEGLILDWFYVKYYEHFVNIAKSEGVAHFTQQIYNTIIINVPPLKEQEKEFLLFKQILDRKYQLNKLYNKLLELKKISFFSKSDSFKISFFDAFNNIEKGSQGFTSLALYNNIPKLDEEKIPFWGGEKEHKKSNKFVSKYSMNIHGESVRFFNKSECIIISMDGSAGSMTYKKNIKFTLNHHAGVLTLKDEFKNKINLKWFSYKYSDSLSSISVSSGSKTLSNALLNNFEFEYYNDILIQNKELELYEYIEKILTFITNTSININSLLNKEIIY
jgi:hypothetical protein